MTESGRKLRTSAVIAILAALLAAGIWMDINAGYRKISGGALADNPGRRGEKPAVYAS